MNSTLAITSAEAEHYHEGDLGPGVPGRKRSELPEVKHPETWELSAHPHHAERAGLHIDLRLGNKKTGIAHSFVLPGRDKLPGPGEMARVIPTFDHTIDYMDYTGPISTTYGKGFVVAGRRTQADVYHSKPGEDVGTKLRFNLYDGTHPEEFSIRKDDKGAWFLHNKTQTRDRRPDLPAEKPAMKEIDIDNVDPTDPNHVLMPKLDGASTVIDLKAGRSPRVFSYRIGKVSQTGLIEHTHKLRDLLTHKVPDSLDGTILRAETIGLKNGRAIPAEQLAGFLNAKVWESRRKQDDQQIKLKAFPFSVVQYKGKNVENEMFHVKQKILAEVKAAIPELEPIPTIHDPKQKMFLLNAIKSKSFPLTDEGVVLVDKDGTKVLKAKITPDYDVHVRDIHAAISGATGEAHDRAGSISYSWKPDGPIVGQLGGFKHDEARDMLANKDKYIGRVAKVTARKVFKGKDGSLGALFQPRFKEWHLDKGEIEKKGMQPMPTPENRQLARQAARQAVRPYTMGGAALGGVGGLLLGRKLGPLGIALSTAGGATLGALTGGALGTPSAIRAAHHAVNPVEKTAMIDAFFDEMHKIADSPNLKISSLRSGVDLYDHQKRAVSKVAENGSLLLSHGTGSGKTLTAIAAFENMRDKGLATKALVVTPASLRMNFLENGINKFTNAKGAIFGNAQEVSSGIALSADNPDPSARYHVVGYEMFAKDPEKYIKAAKADTVIYDELHRIRNEAGETFKTLKEARKHHKNFIGLTGSIMNNTPGDMIPLIDAMTDGNHKLGTKAVFERRFISEDKHGKKIMNPGVVRTLLRPYIDHFDSKDLASGSMPDKIVEEVKVQMSPYQTELYQYAINKMDPIVALKFRFGASKLKERDVQNIFSKIIQARQVSNSIHTMDLQTTPTESAEKTPKIKKLIDDVEDHLSETSDGQVVVHSNLIKGGVDVLQAGFKSRGIDPAVFVGKGNPGVSEESRQKAVREFNSGAKKVIIISAAGGEGLDLKNATMFAGLDGHFNPEKVQQAEARAVRVGGLSHRPEGERKVIIKRYMSVVPVSVTQTAKNVMNLLSPAAFLSRLTTPDAPLLYNPFKRERSPDEWMQEVATGKDTLNAQFREQMKKSAEAILDGLEDGVMEYTKLAAMENELEKIAVSAAQKIPYQSQTLVKSDKSILDSYWKQFGKKIEEMPHPETGEIGGHKNQLVEQQHIQALRDYYREAAKGSTPMYKGIVTDKDKWKGDLKTTLIGGLVSGAAAVPMLVPFLSERENIGESLAILAALPLLGGGIIGGDILYKNLIKKEPVFLTSKTIARKRSRLEDDQLRTLLRGYSISEEVKKNIEHYI